MNLQELQSTSIEVLMRDYAVELDRRNERALAAARAVSAGLRALYPAVNDILPKRQACRIPKRIKVEPLILAVVNGSKMTRLKLRRSLPGFSESSLDSGLQQLVKRRELVKDGHGYYQAARRQQ